MIQSSYTNQIILRDNETKNNNGCSTVLEENTRKDTKPENSMLSLKPVDNDLNPELKQFIVLQDQDSQIESAGNLEGMIDILIKEQQQLKDRMQDQEKTLDKISNKIKEINQNSKVLLFGDFINMIMDI